MTTTRMKSLCLREHEVRALLADGKATLVRAVKPQPVFGVFQCDAPGDDVWMTHGPLFGCEPDALDGEREIRCPFGRVGERRWGKEAYITGYDCEDGYLIMEDADGEELPEKVWHRADREEMQWWDDEEIVDTPWKSAKTMPRWASRLTTETVAVRCEPNAAGVWKWQGDVLRVDD